MINYGYIAKAQHFYGKRGYELIDVPWIVPKLIANITKPDNDCRLFETFAGCLVASGEQSFLFIRERLEPGKQYQCITPCFRDEPVHDDIHLQHFMKLELIRVTSPDRSTTDLAMILADARQFFEQLSDLYLRKTAEGFDLYIGDYEIGSYGIRQFEGFWWVYGTGLAEPRFSFALSKQRASAAV